MYWGLLSPAWLAFSWTALGDPRLSMMPTQLRSQCLKSVPVASVTWRGS